MEDIRSNQQLQVLLFGGFRAANARATLATSLVERWSCGPFAGGAGPAANRGNVHAVPALAGPPDHTVNQAFREYNAAAVFELPLLDQDQIEDLEAGEVVRIVERDGDRSKPARALAFKLSSHPMQSLWVASLDPHLTVDPDLTERRLSRTGERELWYGYYELPYPFSDRHWLVESWNNRALAEATRVLRPGGALVAARGAFAAHCEEVFAYELITSTGDNNANRSADREPDSNQSGTYDPMGDH